MAKRLMNANDVLGELQKRLDKAWKELDAKASKTPDRSILAVKGVPYCCGAEWFVPIPIPSSPPQPTKPTDKNSLDYWARNVLYNLRHLEDKGLKWRRDYEHSLKSAWDALFNIHPIGHLYATTQPFAGQYRGMLLSPLKFHRAKKAGDFDFYVRQSYRPIDTASPVIKPGKTVTLPDPRRYPRPPYPANVTADAQGPFQDTHRFFYNLGHDVNCLVRIWNAIKTAKCPAGTVVMFITSTGQRNGMTPQRIADAGFTEVIRTGNRTHPETSTIYLYCRRITEADIEANYYVD